MKEKGVFLEGVVAFAISVWTLFWMVQPAIYYPPIMGWKWLGFPGHYAFWLLGMVIILPATCFAYTIWANRRERNPQDEKGG